MTRHRPYAELAGLDELEPARRAAARDHLAECPACRERLSFTREVCAAALAIVGEPPADTLARVLARRAAGERIVLPVNDPNPAPAPIRRRVLLVAITAAALVAAVVAAQLVGRATDEVAPSSPAVDSAQRPAPPVGVAMIPGRGPTSVRITGTGKIRVEVLLHGGDELGVRGRGAAVTARFGADGGGITVTGLAGGTVEVRIPRGTITRLFLNERLELTSDGRALRAERSGALSDRATLEIPH